MLKKLGWDELPDSSYKELTFDVFKTISGEAECMLAGGTFRRLIEGQEYTGADFDFYFKSQEEANKIINKFIDGKIPFESTEYKSSNAVTFLIKNFNGCSLAIQLIDRQFFSDLNSLFSSFDIRCCQIGCSNLEYIEYTHYAREDIKKKEIVLINPASGFGTVKRIMKLSRDGYNIDNGALRNLLTRVQQKEIPLFSTHGSLSEEDCDISNLLNKRKKII